MPGLGSRETRAHVITHESRVKPCRYWLLDYPQRARLVCGTGAAPGAVEPGVAVGDRCGLWTVECGRARCARYICAYYDLTFVVCVCVHPGSWYPAEVPASFIHMFTPSCGTFYVLHPVRRELNQNSNAKTPRARRSPQPAACGPPTLSHPSHLASNTLCIQRPDSHWDSLSSRPVGRPP